MPYERVKICDFPLCGTAHSENPDLNPGGQQLLSNGLVPKQRLPKVLPDFGNGKQRSVLYTSDISSPMIK